MVRLLVAFTLGLAVLAGAPSARVARAFRFGTTIAPSPPAAHVQFLDGDSTLTTGVASPCPAPFVYAP
jgi:hypothetical protein